MKKVLKLSLFAVASLFILNAELYADGNLTSQMTSNEVREVQSKLHEKGYNVGKIDGVMGGQTIRAIKQFQRAQNQETTGVLDQKTMASLGLQAGAAGQVGDRPPAPEPQSSGQPNPSGQQPGQSGGTSSENMETNSPGDMERSTDRMDTSFQ